MNCTKYNTLKRDVSMAFCIKNLKYKKTGSHLTMKLQKAFTANNTKDNLSFRANESASATASRVSISLSCNHQFEVASGFSHHNGCHLEPDWL